MQGFIQMKLFLKAFHHFGGELGVERVHLAGFARRQMNNQKGNDRNKKERDAFLNNTAADKCYHYLPLI